MINQEEVRNSISKNIYFMLLVVAFCSIVYAGSRSMEMYRNDITALFYSLSVLDGFNNSQPVFGGVDVVLDKMAIKLPRETASNLPAITKIREGNIPILNSKEKCTIFYIGLLDVLPKIEDLDNTY